jgi:hypothetical protein
LEFFLELFTGASKLGRTPEKKTVGAENERFEFHRPTNVKPPSSNVTQPRVLRPKPDHNVTQRDDSQVSWHGQRTSHALIVSDLKMGLIMRKQFAHDAAYRNCA